MPAYPPQQQGYYSQAYPIQPPQPPPVPVSGPSVHRLAITDPSTGSVIPIITSDEVEEAVKKYHLTSKQSDLVDLDLEELYEKCQAEMPKPTGLRDSTEFVSELLLVAARKGHRFCQYYVGRCFEQGKGVSGDQGQCLQWFQKASEQYIPEATYKLAQCYEDGWGCPQDLPGAVELYKDAALAKVAAAHLRLGFMYENGISMRVDFKKALSSYYEAFNLPEAQYHIGRCHDHGIGTLENKSAAIRWYTKARDNGMKVAEDRLNELKLARGRSASSTSLVDANSTDGGDELPAGIPPQRSKPAENKADKSTDGGNEPPAGIPPQRLKPTVSKPDNSADGGDVLLPAGIPPQRLKPAANKPENSTDGKDEIPAGIPPQRLKPAANKPDPKAKPFTPGVNGIQRNDSGVSRAESSGSGKPDPRAKPFVPPQAMTAKLKHDDGWSDTASGGSDGSALGEGQKPWTAVGKPSGQLTAAAQEFKPKALRQPEKQQPEKQDTPALANPTPDPKPAASVASPSAAAKQQAYPSAVQALLSKFASQADETVAKQSPSKSHAKSPHIVPVKSPNTSPVKTGVSGSVTVGSKIAAQQPAEEKRKESEDLDQLQILQMSTAWTALEEATQAEPADTAAIKAAIRQARPYKELKTFVTAAESLLAALERAEVRAVEVQKPQARAVEAQQTQAAEAALSQSEGCPQNSTHASNSRLMSPASGQLPDDEQASHPGADDRFLSDLKPFERQLASPQRTAAQRDSAADSAQQSPSQQTRLQQHAQHGQTPVQEPVDGVKRSNGDAQASDLPTAAHTAPAVSDAESPFSTRGDAGSPEGRAGADGRASPEGRAGRGVHGEGWDAVMNGTDMHSNAWSPSRQDLDTDPAGTSRADTAGEAAQAAATAAAAAPAPGAGSMQDYLSFLLPAENPAMSAPSTTSSSGAVPDKGSLQQPQARPQPRRPAKPYSSTARAPAAPYRPPAAPYDPTHPEATQSGGRSSPVPAYNPPQAFEASSASMAQARSEPTSDDVLAELFGSFTGASAPSHEPAAEPAGKLRDSSRSPVPPSSAVPRYQPPSFPSAESATPSGEASSAPDRASSSTAPTTAQAGVSSSQPDAQTDSRVDSGAQAQGSAQQGEEEVQQLGKKSGKVRAVDADYTVSSSKAAQQKSLARDKGPEVAPTREAASAAAAAGDLEGADSSGVARAASISSQGDATGVILPPKPKPGGAPKGSRLSRPSPSEEEQAYPQVEGPPPQQPPSSPPRAPRQQLSAPGPSQTRSQPQGQGFSPQQAQRQGASSQQPQQQGPSGQQPQPKPFQPTPTSIPLPANSAWAKKLDLQSRASSSSASAQPVRPSPPQAPTPSSSQPVPSSALVAARLAPQDPSSSPQLEPSCSSASATVPAWGPIRSPNLTGPSQTDPPSSSAIAGPPTPESPSTTDPQPGPSSSSAQGANAAKQQAEQPSPSAPSSSPATAIAAPSSSAPTANAAAAPSSSAPATNAGAAPSPSSAAAAQPSSSATATTAAAERPPSAGATKPKKNRGKKKSGKKGAAANAAADLASSSGQRESSVREVPAGNDGKGSVLTAPGLNNSIDSVTQQPRDVMKDKNQAMMIVLRDRSVTAANRQAWVEICTCPLSLDIMTDPVVANDGITYERADIQEWMNKSSISPWTNQAFENKDLVPNLLVLQLIQQFNLIEIQSQ